MMAKPGLPGGQRTGTLWPTRYAGGQEPTVPVMVTAPPPWTGGAAYHQGTPRRPAANGAIAESHLASPSPAPPASALAATVTDQPCFEAKGRLPSTPSRMVWQ